MSKKSRIKRLFEVADKLAALDLPPLTNEELEVKIQAARERAKYITEEEFERKFQEALKDANATAKKYNITQEDIDAEIRAVRSEKKGKSK